MRIRDLAERQHGVVSLAQLRFLGLSARAVRDRVAAGRLARIHRGVYAVGHGRLTLRGHWMAAVLAFGPRAVLSHRSAAALHGIRPDNRPKIDLTLPSRSARPRPGFEVHTSTTPADEAALLEAGVARVYTPKDFEVSRIMGDIVDLVAEHHGVAAVS